MNRRRWTRRGGVFLSGFLLLGLGCLVHEHLAPSPSPPDRATSAPPRVTPATAPAPPLAEPSHEAPVFRVLVRDDFDRPVAGATVELAWAVTERRSALTGERGMLEVRSCPAGPVLVTVTAPGYIHPDPVQLEVLPGRTAEVRIELTPGLTLTGVVLDETGRPFDAAFVWVTDVDTGRPRALAPQVEHQVRADAGGRFVVPGLAPGGHILHGGWHPNHVAVAVMLPGGPVTLRLRRAVPDGQLRIRVLASGATRPTGCHLVARPLTGGAHATEYAEDGTCVLALVAGDYRVEATCDEGSHASTATQRVTINAGETKDLELVLPDGLELAGRVELPDGNPAPRVYVTALRVHAGPEIAERHHFAYAVTGADGRFVLRGLDSVPYDVGFQAWPSTVAVGTKLRVRPEEGPLIVRLEAPCRIHGRVLDPSGTPVPHFAVNRKAEAHEGGRFDLPLLGGPSEREVIFFADTIGSRRVEIPSCSGTLELGDVRLLPSIDAAGRVVDAETDMPVVGVLLEPVEQGLWQHDEPAITRPGYDHADATRSDANGRFDLARLAQGVPVMVKHPGYWLKAVHLVGGENLIRLSPAATVHGAVNGAREPTCVTASLRNSLENLTTLTDARGQFQLSGLNAGWWSLRAGCDGRESPDVGVLEVEEPGDYSVVLPATR